MKIKYILHFFCSKRDVNGNVYHAVTIVETETGAKNSFKISYPSNLTMLFNKRFYTCVTEMKKSVFRTDTKNWKYLHDIKFTKKGLVFTTL